jgi:hypothetical protein
MAVQQDGCTATRTDSSSTTTSNDIIIVINIAKQKTILLPSSCRIWLGDSNANTVEEQELDEGRSNGSKGKYASRFHPSAPGDTALASTTTNTTSTASSRRSRSNSAAAIQRRRKDSVSDNFNGIHRGQRKQRPLTVGEIAANWQETLREAVLTRYHQEDDPDENHPIDQLHDAIVGNNIIAEIKEENANIGTKSNPFYTIGLPPRNRPRRLCLLLPVV